MYLVQKSDLMDDLTAARHLIDYVATSIHNPCREQSLDNMTGQERKRQYRRPDLDESGEKTVSGMASNLSTMMARMASLGDRSTVVFWPTNHPILKQF